MGTLLIGTSKGKGSLLPFLTGSTSSSLLARLIISGILGGEPGVEPGFASGIVGVEPGSAADSNGIGILGGEPGVEPDLMAVKVLVEGNIDG